MDTKYPYCNPSKDLRKTIEQLKNVTFPQQITEDTLKYWGISGNSKKGIIQVLNFLNFVDKNGNKMEKGGQVFAAKDSRDFDQQFGECIKAAYSELFKNSGEHAWLLKVDQLISFFEVTDHQADKPVRQLQAETYQVLVDFLDTRYISPLKPALDLGLNARIEINLPNDGNKETYDNIFQSVKENLLNDQV